LRNRDLVRSHIHAVWMEVAHPDLGKTLTAVLNILHEDGKIHLPIKDLLKKELMSPAHRTTAITRSNLLINSIKHFLSALSGFMENWVKEVLDQIELSFDSACDRWRELYARPSVSGNSITK